MLGFFSEDPVVGADLLVNPKQKVEQADIVTILHTLRGALELIDEKAWSKDLIVATIEAAMMVSGLKKGQLLWVLRASLTGRAYSPGAYEVAAILGKKETLARLLKVAH